MIRDRDGSPSRMTRRIVLRMIAPVVAVSVMLLAVGGGAAWYVHRSQESVTSLMTEDISGIRAAEELVITASQIEIQLDQFLLDGDPRHLDAIPRLHEDNEEWLAEVEELGASEAEQAMLLGIRRGHERFGKGLAEIRQYASTPESRAAARELSSQVLTKQFRIPAQEYLDSREREVARASTLNQAMPNQVAIGLLLLGTCGAVAGLLAGYGIARRIGRSIAQLSVPIHDAAGKLSQVVGPITFSQAADVADLEGMMRRVADEIATVVERLELSRREVLRSEQLAALGQMAAGLAHELRNPMTSMKILVQSATERGDAASLSGRSLTILEEEITRLEHLIQSFLDFARPAKMEKRRFELGPVVEQILGLVSPRAGLKSVRIEGQLPEDPVVIEADAGHVRQLLLNLLLNALDASPEGATISVQVERPIAGGTTVDRRPMMGRRPDESWLTIRLADRGCGLPSELGHRIFEPFVSTKVTGLGLGLSICKQIVESHGGRIDAADRPGGGAVFTVLIPLGAEDGPAGSPEIRYN